MSEINESREIALGSKKKITPLRLALTGASLIMVGLFVTTSDGGDARNQLHDIAQDNETPPEVKDRIYAMEHRDDVAIALGIASGLTGAVLIGGAGILQANQGSNEEERT